MSLRSGLKVVFHFRVEFSFSRLSDVAEQSDADVSVRTSATFAAREHRHLVLVSCTSDTLQWRIQAVRWVWMNIVRASHHCTKPPSINAKLIKYWFAFFQSISLQYSLQKITSF